MDSKLRLKLALYLNYFVFAILLNSVGIVILKSQNNYGVDEVQASLLELFKDMPIAIVSFLVASFLPRIGYKNAMSTALGIVAVGCLAMVAGNSFGTAKLLFAMVGVSFALIKVSVYSMIGLVTRDDREHSALMSSIEGVFMFGIALAYFLFPAFNDASNPDAWLQVYYLLAALSALSFVFLYTIPVEQNTEIPGANLKEDISQMFGLLAKTLVLVFVISAFLFVLVEQGIMTWLPTFNQKVLHLTENMSIMMSSILAIALGVGRLLAGAAVQRFSWFYVLLACLACSMALVAIVLPRAVTAQVGDVQGLGDLPLVAFAFPMVGLFIGPIYPLLNSAILTALPKRLHSPMTGLIVIFSAIGGTLGSRLIGYLFKNVGADKAFYYTLIPMLVLGICVWMLKQLTERAAARHS
jgi:MFS transporter, FHS family, glucose/mannose:H+ symporter